MRRRITPHRQVLLYGAFLLVSGGVVGERHREWTENARWWESEGIYIVADYFKAFVRIRRNERKLPLEAVERRALAMTEQEHVIDSRARTYLDQWEFKRVRKHLLPGNQRRDPDRVARILLYLRFFRGDYEGILALGAEPFAYVDGWGEQLPVAAEANRALFLRSGDEDYARCAIRHYEDLIGSYAPDAILLRAMPAGPLSEALRDLGESTEAEARLRKVIESASVDDEGGYYSSLAHAALARLMADEGRLEEAKAEAERAFLAACACGLQALYDSSSDQPQYSVDCWRKLGLDDHEIRGLMTRLAGEVTEDFSSYLDYWHPEGAENEQVHSRIPW